MLGQRNFSINMMPHDLLQNPVIPQHAIDVCTSLTLKYKLSYKQILNNESLDSSYYDTIKDKVDFPLKFLVQQI
jgi:hypothetical protein